MVLKFSRKDFGSRGQNAAVRVDRKNEQSNECRLFKGKCFHLDIAGFPQVSFTHTFSY